MEYRLGTCASCQAQYRVPATFKADKAKCKKCEGVVEIGPVQGGDKGASGAVPAAVPPSAKKPAAPRAAAPAKPKAAAVPAPKAGTSRSGSKDSVRSAAEAAADRVRNAGPKKSGASAGGKAAGAKGKPSSRSSSRRTKREPKKKKSSVGMLIGGVVVLAAIAFGAMFFLKQGDSETQAAENVAVAQPEVTEEAAVEVEEAPTEDVEEPEVVDPEPEKEPEPAAPKDPASVDLSLLADQVKLPETSDDDWATIVQQVATFVDPNAGAAGNRSRKQLLALGRVAFPAILNAFKRVDVTVQDGYRTGDLVQKLLQEICRGNNFGWRYSTEPADAYFNKRVIEMWFKSWAQVVENPKAWVQMGKLTEEEAAEYMAAHEDPADIGVSDDLDDF
jgi:hypothetical protein